MQLAGLIPYDENVAEAERKGKSPLMFKRTGKALNAIEELGKKLIMESSV